MSGEGDAMTRKPIWLLVFSLGFVVLVVVAISHRINAQRECDNRGSVLVESGWSYACVPRLAGGGDD